MPHANRYLAIFCTTAGLILAGAGCAEHRPPDALAQAVAMGERPVAMRGSGSFFDGKITATVTLSNGIGRGTGGGGGKGGGGGHHGGNGGAEMPDVSGMDNDEAMAYIRAKSAVGSPLPPVTLHLKIENLTKDTLSVEVDDFDSDLGNFAVHPGILAMAPDQIAEPDPMISQLGVTSDIIPVKVTLKLGGKKETQMIQVKNLLTPAAPPK